MACDVSPVAMFPIDELGPETACEWVVGKESPVNSCFRESWMTCAFWSCHLLPLHLWCPSPAWSRCIFCINQSVVPWCINQSTLLSNSINHWNVTQADNKLATPNLECYCLLDAEINSSHYEGWGLMHNIIMSVAVWGHNESNLGISKPGGCQWLKTQHNYRQQAQSRAEKSLCCKSRSGIVPRFPSQSNPSVHLKHHGATSV